MSVANRLPAPVLMTAHAGATLPTPRMSVSTATRALHIPAEVLAQPGLSLLACAVLAEVLDLHQVKGQVFASDDHFAERCKSKARTVRETIAELEAAGYLTRVVNYSARHKRLLTPTEKWQILPEVVADFATTSPEVVADSAGSSGEIRQELWRNLPGVVAKSANINTNLNTTTNTTLNTNATADAVGVGFEKKIGQEISSPALPAEDLNSAPPVAVAPPAKSRRRTERAGAAPPEPLPEACALADLLNPPGDAHRVQLLAEPLSLTQAERLLADYPEAAVRDILCQMANWQPLLQKATSANLTARNWLTKRAKSLSSQPAASSSHATTNPPSYPGRPTNGAKPTADAGQLARALSRQLRD